MENQNCAGQDSLKILDTTTTAAGSDGLLTACGGGSPLEQVATNLFNTTEANQAATFRNVDRIYPVRVIKRGNTVVPLPMHPVSLAALSPAVDDYMRRNRTAGMLILKRGAISLERYGMGNTDQSRWTSFSVAKSVTSTLLGAALKDGSISSLSCMVSKYLPSVASTEWSNRSLADLLSMVSGMGWDETYLTTGTSEFAKLVQAWTSGQAGAVLELMRTRSRIAPPGSVFNYSTGESYMLGAVVASATGKNLSSYLSEKVWAPLGMEADGYWMLDAPNGLEMGGNSFSATLRDYGRFGQFFLREGVSNSVVRLPLGWRDLAGTPQNAATNCGALYPGYPFGYGYQWWAFPRGADAIPNHDGAFTALGIFGQFIYINPLEDVVAVVWSAWSNTWVDDAEFETYGLIGKAIEILR
jgi:CubicO group peptidase (beta-lactamase class C family)